MIIAYGLLQERKYSYLPPPCATPSAIFAGKRLRGKCFGEIYTIQRKSLMNRFNDPAKFTPTVSLSGNWTQLKDHPALAVRWVRKKRGYKYEANTICDQVSSLS